MSLDSVRAIADAVLLEGYVLYPYRASSVKNRFRFAFGILGPRGWEAPDADPASMRLECLVEGAPEDLRIEGHLRFLRLEDRRIERCDDEGEVFEVDSLEVGGTLHLPWEEGGIQEVPFSLPGERRFSIPGGCEIQWLREGGEARGRVVRSWSALCGEVRSELVPLGPRLTKIRLEVENLGEGVPATRQEALRQSLISTHLLLAVRGGTFLSLLDPPDFAHEAAQACAQEGLFPVLAGEVGRGDLLLGAPILLYDHPAIAPESPGDFFDATEIDELLVLRTSTLTEAEKREARATDPRAARLLDRVAQLTPEEVGRLHGALRSKREIGGAAWTPRAGSRVRIRSSGRRTDAQDALFEGCTATVEKVMQDVSGEPFLALTIEEDPAAELHRAFGRFHYYRLDEVEPLPCEP